MFNARINGAPGKCDMPRMTWSTGDRIRRLKNACVVMVRESRSDVMFALTDLPNHPICFAKAQISTY